MFVFWNLGEWGMKFEQFVADIKNGIYDIYSATKSIVSVAVGIMVTYLSHIEDATHDLLLSMEKNILGIEN